MEVSSGSAVERNESYLDLDYEFELNSKKLRKRSVTKMKIYEGRV